MNRINFDDCKSLGFKREFLNDLMVKKELGFDDFEMKLQLNDTFSMCWEWRDKTVTLYNDMKIVNLRSGDKEKAVKITDYEELTTFLNIVKESSIHEGINYIINAKNYDAVKKDNIKKELISELHKITDGKYIVYLQKDENGKIRILNEWKREDFVFQNPEISKKVCELIMFAFNYA